MVTVVGAIAIESPTVLPCWMSPGGRSCARTESGALSADSTLVKLPVRCRVVRMPCASVRDLPTRSGSWTLPLEIDRFTAEFAITGEPAGGVVLMTLPCGCAGSSTGVTLPTASPRSLSWLRAWSCVRPARSVSFTESGPVEIHTLTLDFLATGLPSSGSVRVTLPAATVGLASDCRRHVRSAAASFDLASASVRFATVGTLTVTGSWVLLALAASSATMPPIAMTAITTSVHSSHRLRGGCSSSVRYDCGRTPVEPGVVGAHGLPPEGTICVAADVADAGAMTWVAGPDARAPAANALTGGADTRPPRAADSRSARNSAADE